MREALIRTAFVPFEELPMDYLLAGLCAAFLFVYLIYALLRPERF